MLEQRLPVGLWLPQSQGPTLNLSLRTLRAARLRDRQICENVLPRSSKASKRPQKGLSSGAGGFYETFVPVRMPASLGRVPSPPETGGAQVDWNLARGPRFFSNGPRRPQKGNLGPLKPVGPTTWRSSCHLASHYETSEGCTRTSCHAWLGPGKSSVVNITVNLWRHAFYSRLMCLGVPSAPMCTLLAAVLLGRSTPEDPKYFI